MKPRQFTKYMCDFETTVYANQTYTEVWAAAAVELFTEDVKIFHSIDELYDYFLDLDENIIAYFHNLKFDGAFWLSFLMTKLNYTLATEPTGTGAFDLRFQKDFRMLDNTFKCSISDKGLWYTITIKIHGHYIILRDSLKLLPFSVKRIGQSFKTKHQKLDMEYVGFRYAGCEITDEEKRYIANDVLVVKEALELMFQEGHDKLTIGSCCLAEYKAIMKNGVNLGAYDYSELYPDMYHVKLDPEQHYYNNAGDWIRRAYRGGWCYLVKGKENRIYHNGTTADVNSLYPSMMTKVNRFPIGNPIFWTGNYIPDEALVPGHFYYVRIKTRFYLKPGRLPFIQIKNSLLYKATECLESSDVYDYKTKKYYTHWTDIDGTVHDTRVELTLTMMDFQLMQEQYDLVDFEILDGCWFYTMVGIFDGYIEKYKKLKMESKGAMRELAKLFLNNLYGKMASSTDSSFKIPVTKEDGSIGFIAICEHNKRPGYIPVGAAITSYARNFTIRAAQANYHGVDKPGFIYADTDSIHCDLPPESITGIKVDDKEFCCWKLESCWDRAIFARQKTYIEHITDENLQPVEKPYYNIKCAGMNQACKDLLTISLEGLEDMATQLPKDKKAFLYDDNGKFIKRDLTDFKIGLKVPGKLMPKRIPGGIVLEDTTFEMR